MNYVIVVLLMVLNFAISFWNAYACGANYTLAKQAGGFAKLMLWSGLTMSACGFTWCYLVLLAVVGMYVPDFMHIHSTAAEVEASGVKAMLVTPDMAQSIMALGYAVIILPILGSGMAIWVESLISAWKQRTFGSIARAGWNTFAQANNIYGVVRDTPSVLAQIGKLFKGGGDGKNKAIMLVIVLVVLAVLGGIITTASIAQWSNKKHLRGA